MQEPALLDHEEEDEPAGEAQQFAAGVLPGQVAVDEPMARLMVRGHEAGAKETRRLRNLGPQRVEGDHRRHMRLLRPLLKPAVLGTRRVDAGDVGHQPEQGEPAEGPVLEDAG